MSQFQLRNQDNSASADQKVRRAGSIIVGTRQLDMVDSTISTESQNAEGGNILIGVKEVVSGRRGKRIVNSRITASVEGGTGKGGNVEILGKPQYLILDNTDVIAKADEGQGGRININARAFIPSLDSEVSASSRQSADGQVRIDSAQIDVENISLLPGRTVDASAMIKDCVALESEEEWSIVQVGDEIVTRKDDRTGCVK